MTTRSYDTGPYDADFDAPHFDSDLGAPDPEERTWALIAHLSGLAAFLLPSFGQIIGPLVVWLVKRDTSPFVADQAKEALNFQITATIAFVVAAVSIFIGIGILLLPAVGIAWLILTVVGGVRANEGQRYRYPFTFRFIQ